MTIGGEKIAARSTFDVRNPATGQVIAAAPECTAGQVDLAMQAAQQAQAAWQSDGDARRTAVAALADDVEQHAAELGALITA